MLASCKLDERSWTDEVGGGNAASMKEYGDESAESELDSHRGKKKLLMCLRVYS